MNRRMRAALLLGGTAALVTTAAAMLSRRTGPSAAGGVSHFQLVRDNVRISLMHSRLMVRRVFRLLFGGLLR